MSDPKKYDSKLTFQQQVKISANMQRIAKLVDRELHKVAGVRVPFSLFTWGGNRTQYVANVARDDAAQAMTETLARWSENTADDPPPHEWKG